MEFWEKQEYKYWCDIAISVLVATTIPFYIMFVIHSAAKSMGISLYTQCKEYHKSFDLQGEEK